MADEIRLLTLDLATRFGWAFGPLGQPPLSGSKYFSKTGEAPKDTISNGAKFWNAMRHAHMMYERFSPTHVLAEMPIAPNAKAGNTQASVFEVLYGLPAAVRGMLYGLGCYNFEYVAVSTVRKHFIGNGGLKGEIAKPKVFGKCVSLRWIGLADEDQSYDRSDALAIWSWGEAHYAPKLAQPVDDLFLTARNRARGAQS